MSVSDEPSPCAIQHRMDKCNAVELNVAMKEKCMGIFLLENHLLALAKMVINKCLFIIKQIIYLLFVTS